MTIEEYDGKHECKIVTGMVVHPLVLGPLAAQWNGDKPFTNEWANIAAGLCVEYFKKYGKAPKKDIEGLIRSWAEGQDEPTIRLVEKFVNSLSAEYESLRKEVNPRYILDLCSKHLNGVRLKRLAEGIQGDVDRGHVNHALGRVTAFHQVELGEQAAAPILNDQQEVIAMFQEGHEPFVEYPGALGDFFQDALGPNNLIAFVAPEKAGKTFWLLDLAFRATSQRKKVAFFEVGDMSKRQISLRFYTRVAAHPFRSPTGEWPCDIRYPTHLTKPSVDGDLADLESEIRRFEVPLNAPMAWEACQKFQRNQVKSKNDYLRLETYPNSTINVAGIRSRLEAMEREDYLPEVIVIDYADILDTPSSKMEMRDQINATWKELRALSQERHCLVVTATQANAKSYGKERPLGRENFSEDKRKMAHVTGMIGINVTDAEKELGLMRLNWIVKREGEYSSRKCVHVASCLPLANPAVLSTW